MIECDNLLESAADGTHRIAGHGNMVAMGRENNFCRTVAELDRALWMCLRLGFTLGVEKYRCMTLLDKETGALGYLRSRVLSQDILWTNDLSQSKHSCVLQSSIFEECLCSLDR